MQDYLLPFPGHQHITLAAAEAQLQQMPEVPVMEAWEAAVTEIQMETESLEQQTPAAVAVEHTILVMELTAVQVL